MATPLRPEPSEDDPFATLASLREAIERWRRSRLAVEARIASLERDEASLLADLERVRHDLATARANRQTLGVATGEVAAVEAQIGAG